MPLPIRIVGVGSANGDDALGWQVVEQLQSDGDLLDGVECYEVAGGQRLLEVLDGCGSLILVDALQGSGAIGSMHRFEWPDRRFESLRPGSTHDMRPAQALGLAAALSLLPPRVVVYGIEMDEVETPAEMSEAVSSAIPELARQIAEEIGGCQELPPRGR